jgi:flavorubredoxin
MDTKVDEIADGIFRLSTFVPDIGPTGFTFNQFLIPGDEPLLFHTGHRRTFAQVREAVARVIAPERLRWITFGHYEADECGAMNEWLALAPAAQVAHGMMACSISLNDAADRPPCMLADGERIEIGNGLRVRYIDTPHVPHGWEAGLLYEEKTGTLLCGDLFTQFGPCPALTEGDIVQAAIDGEEAFNASAMHPSMGRTLKRLATLAPQTLALMHGPSLGDYYDARVRRLLEG